MTDRNGEFMVSEVITLDHRRPGSITLNLQPNPADGEAILSFQLPAGNTDFILTVSSMNGVILKQEHVIGATEWMEYTISTTDFALGVYTIELSSGGYRGFKRMVVVH